MNYEFLTFMSRLTKNHLGKDIITHFSFMLQNYTESTPIFFKI